MSNEWETIYFNFKDSTALPYYGRGEGVRLLFHASGTQFKDTTFELSELSGLQQSGTLPFNQVSF
jgi:hypothetical protein